MDNIVRGVLSSMLEVLGQFICRFTGSAAQLEHTACARRHGPRLVSKKQIFAGTNFRELAFDRENRENFCLAKISRYTVQNKWKTLANYTSRIQVKNRGSLIYTIYIKTITVICVVMVQSQLLCYNVLTLYSLCSCGLSTWTGEE